MVGSAKCQQQTMMAKTGRARPPSTVLLTTMAHKRAEEEMKAEHKEEK